MTLIERIKEMLSYDPKTGDLFWRDKNYHARLHWKRAGFVNSNGYLAIGIGKRYYRASRLAYMMMTDEVPIVVDHINGDKLDNRWINLRNTTPSGNAQNRRVKIGKKTPIGVTKTKYGKYQAEIQAYGKRKYLGTFDSIKKAEATYLKYKKELHI